MPSHEIPTPYPHVQRLMGSGKAGGRQLIKTRVTVGTRIALASRCCGITATFDARLGLPSWAHNAVWPRTSQTISEHGTSSISFVILTCTVGSLSWVGKWELSSLHHAHIHDSGIPHEPEKDQARVVRLHDLAARMQGETCPTAERVRARPGRHRRRCAHHSPPLSFRKPQTASARVFLRQVGGAIVWPFLPMTRHGACMPPRRWARCDTRGLHSPNPVGMDQPSTTTGACGASVHKV